GCVLARFFGAFTWSWSWALMACVSAMLKETAKRRKVFIVFIRRLRPTTSRIYSARAKNNLKPRMTRMAPMGKAEYQRGQNFAEFFPFFIRVIRVIGIIDRGLHGLLG